MDDTTPVSPYPYLWTRPKPYELVGTQLGDPWNVRWISRHGSTIELRTRDMGPPVIIASFDSDDHAQHFLDELALRLIVDALQR